MNNWVPWAGLARGFRRQPWIVVTAMFVFSVDLSARQQPSTRQGSIRGVVYDKDFDAPLFAAQVTIVETGMKTTTADQGNYVFGRVAPGRYTLVFSKDGYVRQVRGDVVVAAGQLTDVNVSLAGDFTEMDELIVQDVQLGAGSEAALLQLRLDSPSLMDSISSDLMSRAGASDAASALRLVPGATVAEGKFAVIRGMPDRYVSSQLNGVRLPTADKDKRAVELDQFPSPVIESIQVSKTFTPDQQGDASGGAVDVRLEGIPDESFFEFKTQLGYNSQTTGRSDFLTYQGGGVDFLGFEDVGIQPEGENWDGAVGVERGDAPVDYKWSTALGGKQELENGWLVGGLASFFYERDSSFFDDGVDDSFWVLNPGEGLTPQYGQGTPEDGDFKTALFDVQQGTESVQWGGLLSTGLETDYNALGLSFLYTHTAESKATLAEDTRGKHYYFPGHDPTDPFGPGSDKDEVGAAPYLRTQTLEYTERTTTSLQLDGLHTLPTEGFDVGSFEFGQPELDWVLSHSSADLDQPDKRQFGSLWHPTFYDPGLPPIIDPSIEPPEYFPFKPGANFNFGNLQRIWKTIEEDSDQVSMSMTLPFEQWSGDEGYAKLGLFADRVDRTFDQDTFSNFGDSGASYLGDWDDFWSDVWLSEDHPITAAKSDVDYDGEIDITAYYGMVDVPLSSSFNVIAGARFESTDISVVNDPEDEAKWFPEGSLLPVDLNPGDADVDFGQDDVLPSIGVVYKPNEKATLRASYSETVARQTFKELTPIIQQEFLGGPVFIGNPDLQMSSLKNFDLRFDYVPYEGGLFSASWFYKDIENPIEYVQRFVTFEFTTARNYPEGELTGYEVELRQNLGRFRDDLSPISIGANATFIDSEVDLPDDEIDDFKDPAILAPITSRDMTNAPEYLYNLYLTYDLESTGTQAALFYTVQGDTLIAGAATTEGNFIPNVYAQEFGTLNFSLSQRIGDSTTLDFKAKNLTNPDIETVYRSDFTDDLTKTSFSRGYELSLGLTFRL